jgi:probable HAF family extracellular repeat protein
VAVGVLTNSYNVELHAASWANGTVTELPTLGGNRSNAAGINNAGQIVGYSTTAGEASAYATEWVNGLAINLGGLGGNSAASGINQYGQVVGWSYLPGNQGGQGVDWTYVPGTGVEHAVLWSDGTTQDLGTLGGGTSFAEAINSAGEVVGASTTAQGNEDAFAWSATTGLLDLNSLILGSGWHLTEATAINSEGDIVGYGTHNGNTEAFLLTPTDVPEPASILMFGTGLLGLGYRLRKTRSRG